jgi:putative component of toxin-antitoxin plasmid stabilization module
LQRIGYEFKSDVIRIYAIKKNFDIIVILGGYKKNQEKDIDKFVKITYELENYHLAICIKS